MLAVMTTALKENPEAMLFPVCSCNWAPRGASERLKYHFPAVFSDLHLAQKYPYAHNVVLKDRACDVPSDAQPGTLTGTMAAVWAGPGGESPGRHQT